jgi:hypothetical protein
MSDNKELAERVENVKINVAQKQLNVMEQMEDILGMFQEQLKEQHQEFKSGELTEKGYRKGKFFHDDIKALKELYAEVRNGNEFLAKLQGDLGANGKQVQEQTNVQIINQAPQIPVKFTDQGQVHFLVDNMLKETGSKPLTEVTIEDYHALTRIPDPNPRD